MLRLFLFLIKILYLKGGEDIMAVIYATLIIKGCKTFTDVPTVIQEQVRQVLTDLDVAELTG